MKFLANKLMRPRPPTASRQAAAEIAGFTLLEVIIAMAIMVLAFASILSVESGSLNASARSKQMNVVAMLAKDKMVQTEYEIEGKTFEEVAKEAHGTFDTPYQDYSWETKIKEVEFPNLGSGGGDSSSGGGSQNASSDVGSTINKLLTQFFSKAMREVTVKIIWKRGSGEQSYSLSTYWVDLNHEFELAQ
jgi:prepilin-type N-terminal cleavage/methylation domain-containing protein